MACQAGPLWLASRRPTRLYLQPSDAVPRAPGQQGKRVQARIQQADRKAQRADLFGSRMLLVSQLRDGQLVPNAQEARMISTLLIWLASLLHPGHCHDCPPPPPPISCREAAGRNKSALVECKDRDKEAAGARSRGRRRDSDR